MNSVRLLLVLFIVSFVFIACEHQEGEGGTSMITGKIFVRDFNADYTVLRGQFYGPDEDVFIIYGDDLIYSDDFKTNYDGSYQFRYLNEGEYTIFAYTEDTTGTIPSGVIPLFKTVEITEDNQEVTVEDIVIVK